MQSYIPSNDPPVWKNVRRMKKNQKDVQSNILGGRSPVCKKQQAILIIILFLMRISGGELLTDTPGAMGKNLPHSPSPRS